MTVVAASILGPPGPKAHVVRAGEDVDKSPRRRFWLRQVEGLTEDHRRARSAAYKAHADESWTEAGELLLLAIAALTYEAGTFDHLLGLQRRAVSRAKWHDARAKGQLERFERVEGCRETWSMTVSCTDCGASGDPQVLSCSHDRLCVHCRGKKVRKLRARLTNAALHWAEQARQLNVVHRLWGYDRLGLKMLTLTLPHSGDIGRDARVLRDSWARFKRRLQAHLGTDRRSPMLQYWRTREETPGTNADGHVHYHMLLVAPHVHHAIYRLLWARSLPEDYRAQLPVARVEWSADTTEVVAIHRTLRSGNDRTERIESPVHRRQLAQALVTRRGPHGRALAEIPWPVVDVRGAGTAHHSANVPRQGSTGYHAAIKNMVAEAAKYVVKDLEKVDAQGNRILVDPTVYAAMYCATDGMRRTSCTRTETSATGAIIRAGWWVIERLQPYICPCPDCGHIGPRTREIERLGHRRVRAP